MTAAVVTYTWKALLERCLPAISAQTLPPDRIVIVDNASTDGTQEMLVANGWRARNEVKLINMPTNSGGASGFTKGLEHAIGTGAELAWMRDEDAYQIAYVGGLIDAILQRKGQKHMKWGL